MTSLSRIAQSEYLTGILRRSGMLGSGRVREVIAEAPRNTILSQLVRLRLTYEGQAGAVPASLMVKTKHPAWTNRGWSPGRSEVAFYSQVASAAPMPFVPRCFDAAWDEGTQDWHLVLEDLADSHLIATEWPLPPTFEQSQAIVRAWARFHAAWWDDPRLGTSVGVWLDEKAMNDYLATLADQTARFLDHLGDRLPAQRRAMHDQLLRAAPALVGRYHSHRHMTLIHGDAHVWNCFLPKDGTSGDVRLFDWDSWRVNVATSDLTYMMALHWYPERRRRFEIPLLDCYHAELLARGVRGYDRAALDRDYRLSVLWQITTPVRQWAGRIPASIWWNHLERIHLAADDLGCRDFLAG